MKYLRFCSKRVCGVWALHAVHVTCLGIACHVQCETTQLSTSGHLNMQLVTSLERHSFKITHVCIGMQCMCVTLYN